MTDLDDLHVVDLRKDGWSLTCPPSCDRSCEVRRAAEAGFSPPPPQRLGRHPCRAKDGRLVIDLDRHVWLDSNQADPGTAYSRAAATRVNRPGYGPVDPAVVKDSFDPWGRRSR